MNSLLKYVPLPHTTCLLQRPAEKDHPKKLKGTIIKTGIHLRKTIQEVMHHV